MGVAGVARDDRERAVRVTRGRPLEPRRRGRQRGDEHRQAHAQRHLQAREVRGRGRRHLLHHQPVAELATRIRLTPQGDAHQL
jgi:hypothetical protein